MFRIANIDDIELVMKFIREEWRTDHILGNDKEFFCWEHLNVDVLDFMLAINKSNGELDGIMGFTRYSKGKDNLHICGIIAKVRKCVRIPYLGMELIRRLEDVTQCKTFCGIGTNPKIMVPLVKRFFNRTTGIMSHYYRLADIDEYKLAVVKQKNILPISKQEPQFKFRRINKFEEINNSFDFNVKYEKLPYKDAWFFEKRYFKHPIYEYMIFALEYEDKNSKAILVAREEEQNGAKILRYIDFIGNIALLSGIGRATQEFIDIQGYEYVEFILKGVNEETMAKAGFSLRNELDENVIPSYFEPFVRVNKIVWFETSTEDMVIFKGDADQDRPNFRKINIRRI